MNNNINQQNDYQSKLNAFYDNEDKNQLEQLRQKYSTVPNYKNMSLRDELQTRFDLNQMNDLEQKFGQEESRCISPRLAYKTPQPKRFSTGEIISDGVKGFGQGVMGAVEHGVNTRLFGVYDLVNDVAFNGGYEKRQKELETLAEQVGLGKAYKYSNYAIDAATMPLKTGIGTVKNIITNAYRWLK